MTTLTIYELGERIISYFAENRKMSVKMTRDSKNPGLRLHFVAPHPGILKY